MRFQTWRAWVGGLPWSLRWFVILVLIRPFLDVMYFLKEISPLLSPLNIVGVLTPLLVVASYFSLRFPRVQPSFLDKIMGAWGVIVALNTIAVLTATPGFGGVEIAIKITTPVILYFFVRHLIRSKTDLVGLLTTFLYASLFPAGMILYEQFRGPLSAVSITRGIPRLEGLYADVMSYAIYLVGALAIVMYFYLDPENEQFRRARGRKLAVVLGLVLLALMNMQHAASWGVSAALVVLLMAHSMGRRHWPQILLLALVSLGVVYAWGGEIGSRIVELYQVDLLVVQGDIESGRMLHGRVSRWNRYLAEWDALPVGGKLLGVPLAETGRLSRMLLTGLHSDYLRILFTSGLIGLGTYLLFHLGALWKSMRLPRPERFVVRAVIVVMLLYSITTTVTIYFPLMYLCLSVLAYAALPHGRRGPVSPRSGREMAPRTRRSGAV